MADAVTVKQGGFPTEREARRALTDALARLDHGVYVDRTRLSVGGYLDQWLEGRVSLRPASVLFYRVAVDRYLKPELGSLRLSDLRADDIDRAFARIGRGVDGRGQPVSSALIVRLKTTLRAALNVAVKRGLVHMNAAQHVEVVAHARPVVRVWDAATTGRFLDATADTPYGALWHLIASSACVGGKPLASAGAMSTLTSASSSSPSNALRSARPCRRLPPRRRRERAPSASMSARSRSCVRTAPTRTRPDSPWAQHGSTAARLHDGGRPRPAAAVPHTTVRAGVPGRRFPPIRLHDLRHISASLGLAAGETLVEISKRLGHSQLAITADTYTHVLPVVALASSEKRAALIPRRGHGGHEKRAQRVLTSDDVPLRAHPPQEGCWLWAHFETFTRSAP